MEIIEMTNERLLREEEFVKRQIASLYQTQKLLEQERARRFDKGVLNEK